MRLILELKANGKISQKEFMRKYYNAFQSIIYNKLSSTQKFSRLHDEKRISNFCFSNLHNVKEGLINTKDTYRIIISSPNPEFISSLFFTFLNGETLNIGEGSFTLNEIRIMPLKIKRFDVIENVTILNLTKHVKGRIKPLFFNKEYINALSKNLIHKYNEYNSDKISETNLFENVEIQLYNDKVLSQPLIFTKNETVRTFNAIGYLIRFKIGNVNDQQMKVLQYCFDTGFGERTSYGLGFMIKRWKK
jgi:CRISPR-associated endoribonuclease Cas6